MIRGRTEDCAEDILASYGTTLIEDVFEAISSRLPLAIRSDFESCRRRRDREGMERICWEEGFGWLNTSPQLRV